MPASDRSEGALPPLAPGPIDAHAHVFTCDLAFVPGSRYVPSRDASDAAYRAHLRGAGVGAALLVQPSFLGEDNSYMLAAVARAPACFRAVAVVSPRTDQESLHRLARAGVVGVRLNLIGAAVPDPAQEPWRGWLARLDRAGLFIEVQAEGEQWPAMLAGLPVLGPRVVIDHMGRPASGSRRDPVFNALIDAACRRNVWVKLSAPYRFASPARDVVAELLQRAGPSRLVWGSDWPWTQHPEITDYPRTMAWLEEWVPCAETRRAIFDANPRRLIAAD